MKKPHNTLRRNARRAALQALYQWDFNSETPEILMHHFIEAYQTEKMDEAYFCEIVNGAIHQSTAIDETIKNYLDRKLNELNPVELAVLRVAVFELTYRLDIPYRVIINEALELTKEFGSVEGHKYVNGVLDKIAKQLRAMERSR